ncbi:MAG: hypothetical protein K2J30_00600 [Clostridia bacterium]|nr:hypothetical protein [Clostridia bacterium]
MTEETQGELSENQAEFVKLLYETAGTLKEMFESGNGELIGKLNKTVKQMYHVQRDSKEDVMQLITPDCEVLYKNVDMMTAVLRTTENGVIDDGARKAIGKFLHNINEAVVNIATVFGLV